MDPILQADHVNKKYRLGQVEVDALRAVSFAVAPGEFVAIMGASGSGKSTLLHLLGGLDQPSDGEITLAGKRLAKLKDDEITLVRRRNVGFIFQFYNLVPTLTAEENVVLALQIDGKNPRDYAERIETLLDLVGLQDRRHHKPDQLSGGEQQRVAIARALITQPSIVLADEPTGNLDSRTGEEILRLLRRSCDELRQTIVIVTHDARAASFADRAVFLKDGAVVDEVGITHRRAMDDADFGRHTVEVILEKLKALE